MRILMWLAMGFLSGCVMMSYLSSLPVWVPLVLAGLLIAAGLKWKRLRPGMILGLGLAAGVMWFGLFSLIFLSEARNADGKTVDAQIQITDYSRETNYGCSADGVVKLGKRTYQVRVYVNAESPLEPDDTVSGQFRMRMTALGGEEELDYFSGKGIFLLAYQRSDVTVGKAAEEHWRSGVSRMQQ